MSRTPAAPRASLLLLAYLAFVSLGLPDGLIGVGWPSIRVDLGVPTEAVGVVLTAGTVAYLTSSVLAGFTLARLGVGWLLAGSTLLAAVALTGYALTPALAVLVGFALVLGIGSGAIDAGLNAYAAGAFGPRHMNWMHAFFGLGVALGPLIMTGVLGAGLSWRWGYAAVATAQLALATAFALTVRAWRDRGANLPSRHAPPAAPDEATSPAGAAGRSGGAECGMSALPAPRKPQHAASVTLAADPDDADPDDADPDHADPDHAEPRPRPTPIRETLRLPAVWLGGAAFAVYVAIEVTTGLWAYLLLTEGRGMAGPVAGLCVSGYWGSLFLGRVVQGLVAERLGSGGVLRGSLLGMVAGTALIALPAPAWVTVAGLVVVGFAAAPVFPLLTLTTAERVGPAHADRTIGLQMGAAGVGAALVPAGVGVLLARTSVVLLGSTLVLLAVALLALHVVGARRAAPAA
ncbi:sugar MFS transporter [Micromonospora sp. HK10]|uniref:MFS transporter n=1 Tax=Micromonospora sp. HK10 TaxID=1538294 RepID=UPI000626F551|nr:MFS transporter [Micromonospora sp. HK10]KKJ96924.1 MFS transporter [Micromonospora sp. HK10]